MADHGVLPLNRIEPLTGINYHIWALKVGAILRSKRLFRSVIEENEPSDTGSQGSEERKLRDKWIEMNDDAFGIIIISLSPEQAGLFIGETNAKRVWNELKRIYAGNVEDRIIDTQLELQSLKMENGENVDAYVTRARNITTKCNALGKAIRERELVFYIVRGLSQKLENIAAVLRPQRAATLDEVYQALREEEVRINIKNNGRGMNNSVHSEKAYKARDERKNYRHQTNDRGCFICGKKGHIAKNCYHRKDREEWKNDRPQRKQDNSRRENAKAARDNIAESALRASEIEIQQGSIWNLDSGCTSHMTSNLDWMDEVEEVCGEVNLAENGRTIEVEGKGKVRLSTVNGNGEKEAICIHDVLYVPKLRSNLLSVRSIVSKGNNVIFNEKGAQILNKQQKVIAQAIEKNRMYILETYPREGSTVQETSCLVAKLENVNTKQSVKEKWHRRLGHVSGEYMEKMVKNNMVRGLNIGSEKLGVCEPCIKGKMVQSPFRAIDNETTGRPLELIHIDLCGPMPEESLGGKKYIFMLVDSFSKRMFVYFLRTKNEAFEHFINFKKQKEVEVGSRLMKVRSDNGTEFVNHEFEEYFKREGIQHQRTTPYCPQSNGVAERANRTILEKTRVSLIESQLPHKFWAEAVATAVYNRNRTPTQTGGDKTPMEKWNGIVPQVAHMKVFGCIAYYYVPKVLRNKLQPRAITGIFMGYSEKRKAYRIFDPTDQKIHESRSVRFNEDINGGTLIKTGVQSVMEWPGEDREIGITKINIEAKPDSLNDILMDYATADTQIEDTPGEPRKVGRKKGETNEDLQERHRMQRKENEDQLVAEGARRSERIANQANLTVEKDIPITLKDAVSSQYATEWKMAMEKEMESLQMHGVWKLVTRNEGMKVLKNKWVYSIKRNQDGTIDRRKARLVAAGYGQRSGIDFEESFSPVMKMESFRTMIAIAAHRRLKVRQYDVQTAYLYGQLRETIYMEQPQGYIDKGNDGKVCELQKSIYGLPQSGRNWNEKVNEILLQQGMNRLDSDQCIYVKYKGDGLIMIGVYVDDLLVCGTDDEIIDATMEGIKREFQMKEKLNPETFLGIEVRETNGGITLSQRKYVCDILEKYGMSECKPVGTPGDPKQDLDKHMDSKSVDQRNYQEIIGSLMYLSNGTRPDITYYVSRLSQFLRDPRLIHLTAAKRILRYLQGTKTQNLLYDREIGVLTANSDASWCTTSDAKSFTGYTIKLGNSLIGWRSRKQKLVALSTCEAEMMAICETACETKWMVGLLDELGLNEYIGIPIVINTDSKSAMDWFKRRESGARTKHINRKFCFVREDLQKGNLTLNFVGTDDMEADFLTKGLCGTKIAKCKTSVGINQ